MATVTEVTVSASRKFNHPYEDFSNLGPLVSIKATVHEGEDPEEVIKGLQAKAEGLVEDHKQHMLESLRQLHLMSQYERKVASLETTVKGAQAEIERLRKEQQSLVLALESPEGEEEGQLPF